MPRVRSLVERISFDRALRAHDCQASAKHRVSKGELRLKVRNGRSWDHYCLACAQQILRKDVAYLKMMLDVAAVPGQVLFAEEIPADGVQALPAPPDA